MSWQKIVVFGGFGPQYLIVWTYAASILALTPMDWKSCTNEYSILFGHNITGRWKSSQISTHTVKHIRRKDGEWTGSPARGWGRRQCFARPLRCCVCGEGGAQGCPMVLTASIRVYMWIYHDSASNCTRAECSFLISWMVGRWICSCENNLPKSAKIYQNMPKYAKIY